METATSPRSTRAIVALVGALSLGVAACGDDALEPAAPVPDSTVPDDTDPASTPTTPDTNDFDDAEAIPHPNGADEVVIRIAYEGGFMPVEGVFTQLPTLLVAGDGRAFTQGPQIAIYPGPLLPNVLASDLGDDGVQRLLRLADEHGLLADREYEAPVNVADAPDTVVTIHAGGETFEHRAYALGIGGGPDGGAETGDRAELQAFVEAATSGANGETDPADGVSYAPDHFLMRTMPVETTAGYDIEPTVVPWPDEVDVDLAAATDCLQIVASAVADLFAEANQLTFFEQDGVTYQVLVKPQLPGMTC